jgi:hypothetical protein
MGKRGKAFFKLERKAPPGRQIINIHPLDLLYCSLCDQPLSHGSLYSHTKHCPNYSSGDDRRPNAKETDGRKHKAIRNKKHRKKGDDDVDSGDDTGDDSDRANKPKTSRGDDKKPKARKKRKKRGDSSGDERPSRETKPKQKGLKQPPQGLSSPVARQPCVANPFADTPDSGGAALYRENTSVPTRDRNGDDLHCEHTQRNASRYADKRFAKAAMWLLVELKFQDEVERLFGYCCEVVAEDWCEEECRYNGRGIS